MQSNLYNRLEHQLGNTVTGLNMEGFVTIVCQNDTDFSMIVRIDNTDALCNTDTMLQRQSRTRGNNSYKTWVHHIEGNTGLHQ